MTSTQVGLIQPTNVVDLKKHTQEEEEPTITANKFQYAI